MDIVWKLVYLSPMTDDGPLTKHLFRHARKEKNFGVSN